MVAKNREPIASLVLYHLLKWPVVSPLLHTYFRANIYGAAHVPKSGAAIAVSNHASYFDPPIISNCIGRPVAFMAKQELFEIPVFKNAIELYGAYPVNRSISDRSAIRSTMQALESGWIAGIFLQGTRTKDGKITNPKSGAALIAAKAQVPLIPISLWGTERILSGSSVPKPIPLTIRIGDLIAPPQSTKREELTAVTTECAKVINQLHALGR
ncbi:1-acyl-sn-glycerol-3-phosphate acyltransferase [Xenococcus sp. PCC 7305]|uniref:lysophospholipid acyltransferase family protein n=1 Tax=Xenococcus sp. PCC 7305 TaxID=102125 RepID=UPI0002AD0E88|nr:lysophospholipid acyltransferase family protein [Xenococcus sp. PCC 7305]ELS03006.1 1-acyl-sn-glycerol-3-phosphate acyltransferase [Xenococcus sp. PCC 7305]